MDAKSLIMLDLKETRRRFIKAASAIPDRHIHWQPDATALSVGQMIRHVLEHDYYWHMILTEQRLPTEEEMAPMQDRPYTSIQDEIVRSEANHARFLSHVESLDVSTFGTVLIRWPHRPIERCLGDALERKSYHDAVHTGQLLQYMRLLQISRPDIWD
ncbi:DinB family protein [Cohnella sp. GbtcB17]|uniref:DinB family protein n=1 Tax=Cohnella sp. GbtcB17 TaxID=2824762 RepID=UPI001C30EF97|nr:DinB family protein [Cohnella sp. GbtcB17]